MGDPPRNTPEQQPPDRAGDTLCDFLSGYVGTISGTSDPLSEDTGRRFADGMLEKQEQGRL